MGGDERIDYRVVPSAIFTSPEIASVGLREQQANEKGIKVTIGRFPFRVLGKAQAMGEIEGVIKILSDSVSDRVLGVHIIDRMLQISSTRQPWPCVTVSRRKILHRQFTPTPPFPRD
jgi:pyruvate/2-oxoglutarate dehydrogenase complex dihydrolipoamide dehydrogenase (E3) component